MRRSMLSAAAALVLFAVPATGMAQDHAATTETLDAIALSHVGEVETDRAEVRAFLNRPEVRDVAGDAGFDIVAAESAVATLGATELRQLAGQVSQYDAALAGGDSLVISSTLVIILLLVLIIILVA